MTMQVKKADLVQLYEELGLKNVDSWPTKLLSKKIPVIPELAAEFEDGLESPKAQKTLDAILEALHDEEIVELMGEISIMPPTTKVKKTKVVEEEEDEEQEEVPAKKKVKKEEVPAKKKVKKEEHTSDSNGNSYTERFRKVGICGIILDSLTSASKKNPASKDGILKLLTKKFKDRNPIAMARTINGQIHYNLKKLKNIDVSTNGEGGFWIVSAPKKKLVKSE
jgi:outer membrane biosynthesis protein TonB